MKEHTSSICALYCYSLLPNHFHLLARINDEESLVKKFKEIKKTTYNSNKQDLSEFIMERFSNFLNSYTKVFNKMYQRKGALFMDYMKRSIVNYDADFTSYIWYIHKNAVHHKLARKPGEWRFDSYHSILSEAPTMLLREEVVAWFGNKNEYIKFHQQEIRPKEIGEFL